MLGDFRLRGGALLLLPVFLTPAFAHAITSDEDASPLVFRGGVSLGLGRLTVSNLGDSVGQSPAAGPAIRVSSGLGWGAFFAEYSFTVLPEMMTPNFSSPLGVVLGGSVPLSPFESLEVHCALDSTRVRIPGTEGDSGVWSGPTLSVGATYLRGLLTEPSSSFPIHWGLQTEFRQAFLESPSEGGGDARAQVLWLGLTLKTSL